MTTYTTEGVVRQLEEIESDAAFFSQPHEREYTGGDIVAFSPRPGSIITANLTDKICQVYSKIEDINKSQVAFSDTKYKAYFSADVLREIRPALGETGLGVTVLPSFGDREVRQKTKRTRNGSTYTIETEYQSYTLYLTDSDSDDYFIADFKQAVPEMSAAAQSDNAADTFAEKRIMRLLFHISDPTVEDPEQSTARYAAERGYENMNPASFEQDIEDGDYQAVFNYLEKNNNRRNDKSPESYIIGTIESGQEVRCALWGTHLEQIANLRERTKEQLSAALGKGRVVLNQPLEANVTVTSGRTRIQIPDPVEEEPTIVNEVSTGESIENTSETDNVKESESKKAASRKSAPNLDEAPQ